MAPAGALLRRSLKAYQVYGANTDVGKTIFTTLLCKACQKFRPGEDVSFLKPVSTGPQEEADDWCSHINTYVPGVATKTLFQFEDPVSPHLAAATSKQATPSDHVVLQSIRRHVSDRASSQPGWLFLETAGGVHSPGPSGTTQADLYAPLRLPVVLIGDSKLGGISQTIAAFESLRIRGYDVETVLLFQDSHYDNHTYLSQYFAGEHGIPLQAFQPPPRRSDRQSDVRAMSAYYETETETEQAPDLVDRLERSHQTRIKTIETMAGDAYRTIWYPFTQHGRLSPSRITTITSAHGDYFQTLVPDSENQPPGDSLLQPSFDASASWWTQGLGHANPKLTLAASYAAGRYGHVMFAEAIHEPALKLAQTLLGVLQNPRLSRVFYSDNGSTGMEVAVKMGLRATRQRYNIDNATKLQVLGLKGSYHGDTMGAMDSTEPSVFNEKVEWYDGKGYWDPLFQRALIDVVRTFPELLHTRHTVDASSQGPSVWTGLPVIFDEVFTGLGRLGPLASASFLGAHPDISVHAKLLTGGLVPLCATAASESVFEAFNSQHKTDALLHGHSYTAHPVGCQVALESVNTLQNLDSKGAWDWAKQGWEQRPADRPSSGAKAADSLPHVWSVWSNKFVTQISAHERVEGVWALGSVLAVHMKDAEASGYTSNSAAQVQQELLAGEIEQGDSWNVHSRVLGNVLYIMTGQMTDEVDVQRLQKLLARALG
ncbi:unnamed protein product [Parascedosporium putredinis]|uniref:Uncharacterized protein n=1 Tax=Parascedosporium putredinis TaxID=1442378 RepID=A0A9P1M954_9PEZI|nr:unnamed protein product [Parascedosporium putredinis]CAI7990167.1 unnamed protein product [Parascedosporium putredinis]